MKYPTEVYELAKTAKLYQHHNTTSWQQVYGLKYVGDLQEYVVRTAAYKITQEFVHNVVKHHQIQTQETPDGVETSFTAVALSWPELLELLYRAFAEGQSNGMRRTSMINNWIDQHQTTQDA